MSVHPAGVFRNSNYLSTHMRSIRIDLLALVLAAASISCTQNKETHVKDVSASALTDSTGSIISVSHDSSAIVAPAVGMSDSGASGHGSDSLANGNNGAGSNASSNSADTRIVRRVATPDTLRGLYVNRWAAVGAKVWQLIDVAKRTEINALVIDVKDDRGFVLYPSNVPLAKQIGADTNHPMSRARMAMILDSMAKYNIYPIARIVVAKDPLLAEKHLEWSIKRKSDGKPWLDKNKKPWLDPHVKQVWDYSVDLAKEAYELGFAEIQLDYVRFPDDKRLATEATFPLANGRVRADVIREQLMAARKSLKYTKVPFSIDVFGLTGTAVDDMGIGQLWEKFIDAADYVLPMTYPSHYAVGSYGIKSPNANPYDVIDRAIKDMRRRTDSVPGAAKIILWYQDFTLGPPKYGAAEVRAQIKAGYDNGIHSWILWNPRSVYTIDALRPKK